MERRSTTPAQRAGDDAEDEVVRRLLLAGWVILGRNVRLGRSELDVVAVDIGPPSSLVVVEVRWRNRRDFGLAEETLDHRKRAALRRGIGEALARGTLADGTRLPAMPLRVDLVVVEPAPGGGLAVRHHRAIRV